MALYFKTFNKPSWFFITSPVLTLVEYVARCPAVEKELSLNGCGMETVARSAARTTSE